MQDIALERHYTVFELAQMWNVSHMTIRRMFESEPGVLIFGSDETRYGRRRTTMRIPESVAIRVHRDKHTRRTASTKNCTNYVRKGCEMGE
jgi:hypothetical protein